MVIFSLHQCIYGGGVLSFWLTFQFFDKKLKNNKTELLYINTFSWRPKDRINNYPGGLPLLNNDYEHHVNYYKEASLHT